MDLGTPLRSVRRAHNILDCRILELCRFDSNKNPNLKPDWALLNRCSEQDICVGTYMNSRRQQLRCDPQRGEGERSVPTGWRRILNLCVGTYKHGRSRTPAFRDTNTSMYVGRSQAPAFRDTNTSMYVVYLFCCLNILIMRCCAGSRK